MPQASNPAQDHLAEHFPISFRRQVPAALRRGYRVVDEVISKTPWLQTASGRFQRGDLIVLAVEYEFVKLATTGFISFEPVWENYAAPTGKHLVLRNDSTCVTINQIEAAGKKPRKAVFRNSLGIPNTRFLFDDWNREIAERDGLAHTLILHGYRDLTFAHLAVPNPAANALIEWTDNLLDLPHAASDTEAQEEGPSQSPEPEGIENLLRKIRDAE